MNLCRNLQLWTIALLAVGWGACCHAANDTLIVAVHYQQQPEFSIKLPANPSTGYQWEVSRYDPKVLELLSRAYHSPERPRIGQMGETVFTWRLLRPQMKRQEVTKIQLNYCRSWEKDKPAAKTQTIAVMIM